MTEMILSVTAIFISGISIGWGIRDYLLKRYGH